MNGERMPAGSGSRLAVGVLALILAAASGCAPLPPEGGLGVTAGRLSDQWLVRWDSESRTPTQMMNRSLQDETPQEAPAISDSAAGAAVWAVLLEHQDWFRLRPGVDDFVVVRSYSRGWVRFLRIGQTYKGVPIAGAGYDARVLSGGRVGSLEGRFHPEIEMNVDPVLSPDQAETRAQTIFAGGSSAPASLPRFQFEYENGFRDPRILVLVPQGRQYTLAWGVVVRAPPTGSWRVYVDATSGAVVGCQLIASDTVR